MTVPATEALDAATVRDWFERAADGLARARADLDRANLFPVADADTGTNLHATVSGALRGLDEHAPGDGPADVLTALADGVLAAARGNSGTILGAYLRGWADAAADGPLGPAGCVRALDAAALAALASVASPAPGTVLTAARRAADAAADAYAGAGEDDATAASAGAAVVGGAAHAVAGAPPAGGGIGPVLLAARSGARAAAARSADDLPEPVRRGLPDAGALGLVVILDALAEAVTGEAPAPLPGMSVVAGTMAPVTQGPADGEFEVVFAVEAADDAADALRRALTDLGSSVVVAGADRLRRVHVHADDPAAVLRLGAGAPGGGVEGARVQVVGPARTGHVVAYTRSPGLLADLARAGATACLDAPTLHPGVIPPPPEGEPEVLVLPSRPLGDDERGDLVRVLGAAGARVEILPTAADVQVIAALAAAQAHTDPGGPLAAMRAVATAMTVTRTHAAALPAVPPGALVTVVADQGADAAALGAWSAAVTGAGAEVVVLGSGRPAADVEIGVEEPS